MSFIPRQLSLEDEKEVADRVDALIRVGKQSDGTSLLNDTEVRPAYFDEAKFHRAQKTINKYYASLSVSSTTGLMLLLQLDEILTPLLKTGKSRTVVDLYDRYSATAMYIKHCYETNFFDPASKGWKYVKLVRGMHQRANKLLNSSECGSLGKPAGQTVDYVWVNQYDMALTQFAFVGLFILRPDKCGAYRVSEIELSDIVYYWQLLSYQLGIENQFNLFVYSHDMSKQFRLLSIILNEFKQKLASSRNRIGLEMSRGFLLAFEDLATETTFNIVEHHWAELISMSGSDELEPYEGFRERWKLIRFKLIFECLLKSEFLTRYINQLYKRKLVKFCEDSEKIKKKLSKKYPNHIYQLEERSPSTPT